LRRPRDEKAAAPAGDERYAHDVYQREADMADQEGKGDFASGERTGPQGPKRDFAEGEERDLPGAARDFAEGEEERPPGSAADFAEGQEKPAP